MLAIPETAGHVFKFATTLHIDVVRTIHQDFGDGLVSQQRLQWSPTEGIGDDGYKEVLLFLGW